MKRNITNLLLPLLIVAALALLISVASPASRAASLVQDTLRIECPEAHATAGTPLNFSVDVGDRESVTWTTTRGRITRGQGTPGITIDTTGLAGQTITVTAETRNPGTGCSRTASCAYYIPRQ